MLIQKSTKLLVFFIFSDGIIFYLLDVSTNQSMKIIFSYSEAVKFLESYNLNLRSEYRELLGILGAGFPLAFNPEVHYGEEFISWEHYLSSKKIEQPELQRLLHEHKISSKEQYKNFYFLYGKKFRIPRRPHIYYKKVGFIGYRALFYREMRCLACASYWASKQNIDKAYKWHALGRKKIPKSIHLDLTRYGDVDFSKFIKGDYHDSDCCTCEGVSYWEEREASMART